MKLFLLRHAEAALTIPDESRELTPFGRSQIKDLVSKLDTSEFANLKRIEHSPRARTQESARLFLQEVALPQPLPLIARNDILPDFDARQTATGLATSSDDRLLVGHNPHLEMLVSLLLGQERIGVQVAFKTAACIALECFAPPAQRYPYGYWQLHWLVVPQQP